MEDLKFFRNAVRGGPHSIVALVKRSGDFTVGKT